MKKLSPLSLAVLPLLLLGACSSNDAPPKSSDIKTPVKEKPKLNTDQLICPQVAILQDAQVIRDYGGEKPDPSQLVAIARMKSIEGDCGYKDKGVDISFVLHLTATRGKKLGGGQVSFPYFIAIVDPSDNIVTRQIVTAHFEFSGSDKKSDDDEAMHVFVPLSPDLVQGGPDYRVLIGFTPTKGTR